MSFPKLITYTGFSVIVGLTALPNISVAESDPQARFETRIGVGVRYPGDTALKEGTVRAEGPDKGAYIERCQWRFKRDVHTGYGLTQSCFRYTLKNTR